MLFDVLYTNGVFHTPDPDRPRVRKLGFHAGRIVSLDDELPAEYFRDVWELGGAAVVPGFNDAHCHLTYVGQFRMQVDLRPAACPTTDDLIAAVGAPCAEAPESGAVRPMTRAARSGCCRRRRALWSPTASQRRPSTTWST